MIGNEKDSIVDAGEAFKALRQRWIPDVLDEDDELLPSFADLKNKTLRDLYGVGGNDKSPKGSVDVAVRPLVDLINVHPSFATLSSCSGRIALFDPQMKRNSHGALQDEIMESGKGHGGWLLASHETVAPSTLVELLDRPGEPRGVLIFKHEPLLLHVAASSLTRGRQLLSLALQLGFRESGLVVSNNRVTVAIRSHSLALCVPLSRRGPLRPSNTYLEALVEESNMRLRANQDKLVNLCETIQQAMFRLEETRPPQVPLLDLLETGTVIKLPAINLWGHATVAVPAESNDGADILVFGGYGEGPDLSGLGSRGGGVVVGKRCCRSNRVYCLRHRNGSFEDHWTVVRQDFMKGRNVLVSNLGVVVLPADFTPREGLDACLLPTTSSAHLPVVALWGGRASPGKPFNDLMLYEPSSPQPLFMKPLDIRGTLPEARWGHSLTALSGKDGLMAVLVGGRNEQTAFASVHVLTLITNESVKSHFHWATLDLDFLPRFHHTTVTANDFVYVFGGLSDVADLVEGFSSHSNRSSSVDRVDSQPSFSAFQIRMLDNNATANDLHETQNSTKQFSAFIGGSGCAVNTTDESGFIETLVALTGGVSSNAFEMKSIMWFEIAHTENAVELLSRSNDMKLEGEETIDFGSMVHHCCVSLPSDLPCVQFVLVGGGVPSFAFGPSFAECYHVRQTLQLECNKQQESAPVKQPAKKEASPKPKDSPQVRFKLPDEDNDSKQQATTAATKMEQATDTGTTKEETTSVLFVMANDAKTLKTALEKDGFLDKKYRMTEAGAFQNAGKHIAVPITKECLSILETGKRPSWYSLVVARGSQKVPFSTAMLGRQTK